MRKRSLLDRIALLGRAGLDVLAALGRSTIFLVHALFGRSGLRNGLALLIRQLYSVGVLSLAIIVVSGIFIGMVLALQGYNILSSYGSEQAVGQMVALTLLRELGPVVTALLFAGRAGSALAARDPERLAQADVVLDVGGVYDVTTLRFDHHQKSSGARPSGILFSAFGLLWQHYGLEYCGGDARVHGKIDRRLVTAIDAVDNGQDLYTVSDFGTPPFDISSTLGLFNPLGDDESFDGQFRVAVDLARTLLARLRQQYVSAFAAEDEFKELYAATPDKRFVVLEKFMPHGSVATAQPELLFTVFPGATGNWTIQTVRPEGSEFGSRKHLPAAWRGLNDAELAAVTGVEDAVFCHKAGFIGAARSREGALRLLELALEHP